MSANEYPPASTARPRVLAIDPPGCGCTECITGEYVPLGSATPEQIRDAQLGRIGDNTGGLLPEPTAEIALMKLRDHVQAAFADLAETGLPSWYAADGFRMVLSYIDEALKEDRS